MAKDQGVFSTSSVYKNGDRFDNRIENLTILCPDCHSQTPTFRGRNKKGVKTSGYYKQKEIEKQKAINSRRKNTIKTKTIVKNRIRVKTIKLCQDCGCQISKNAITYRCSDCSHKTSRKAERPPREQLLKMVEENGYCATGRKFGVSDNAIRKWLKTASIGDQNVQKR